MEEAINVGGFIAAKSDQINADDLIAGPIQARIARVALHKRAEQALEITLEGHDKVWRPCKTMARVMSAVWGENAAKWVGECLELYRETTVTWGKDAVGGIRISAISKAGFEGRLNATKGKKAAFTVRMMNKEEIAALFKRRPMELADFIAAANAGDAKRLEEALDGRALESIKENEWDRFLAYVVHGQ